MLEHIELILSLFLLFYVLIILYDVMSLFSKKTEITRNDKKRNILINLIVAYENEQDKKEKKKINKKLTNKLKRLSYLSNLGTLLEKNVKIKSLKNKEIIDILSNHSYDSIFIALASIYNKKDSLTKSYYAYILKYVHPNHEEIYKFLYSCILTPSIYSVEIALFTFYNIGDSNKVCEAYKIMNRENIYYNHKLISDGIMEFTGSKKELCNALYQNFDIFNEEIKIGFLTFFRNCGYDIGDELLKRLQTENMEKEVEIAMIRYFCKIYSEKANKLFIKRIKENYYHDFDYDIVMIQVLGQMKELSKEIIEVLVSCLSNPNYYVRYNAGKVLHNKIDLRTIKNVKDPFMKDMIEYFISQEV